LLRGNTASIIDAFKMRNLLRGSTASIIDAIKTQNLLRGNSASIFMRLKRKICCVATLRRFLCD
jgi:hypothetical protein